MVTFFSILGVLLLINFLLFKFSVAGGPVIEKSQKHVTPKQSTLTRQMAFNKAS
ncbi:hypothetical protein DSM03_10422 [Leeuwenhoekiella aestuarii]|uniref:Uncharacterized protein n=2 Tax=Leeuwenhoekiella TaxID=283735 RepID=A0A4Q0NRU4_9FLAO|nr:hypothetical protein DSM04_105383 [Leeuwenhoekiella aestuarii]RXG14867.1 hypothetical protein DSM03_10422 [Leeuwenhoekiella aestuarii]RXG26198.1 hypothetical protein DSM02_192 [Leeuwenhoekiella polynyae]